jgi:3-dehydroquinate synthase
MNTYPSPLGDIYLGSVLDGLASVIEKLQPSSILLLADSNTIKYCIPLLEPVIRINQCIVIQASEQSKTLSSCQDIWASLTGNGADRSALVLNVGGGMICDLGGFASACFQRGIRFGHIPTSLLSMADAAIGGKTGINFEGYKNYIGRFEAPSFIWIDTKFLETLPIQEIKDGLAEIIKHAIIGSRALWDLLSRLERLSSFKWPEVLEENVMIKKRIVEVDPHEKGLRKVLNFGHTIGHALESHHLSGSYPISHGQAVTLGMLAESKLANMMGLLDDKDFQSIIELIHRLLGQVEVTLPSVEEIRPWISGDKKKTNGQVGFSLPDRIGSCGWNIVVKEHDIANSLEWLATQVRKPSVRLS